MGTVPKIVATTPQSRADNILQSVMKIDIDQAYNAAGAIRGLGTIVFAQQNGEMEGLNADDMASIGLALMSLGVLVEKIAEGVSADLSTVRSALNSREVSQ